MYRSCILCLCTRLLCFEKTTHVNWERRSSSPTYIKRLWIHTYIILHSSKKYNSLFCTAVQCVLWNIKYLFSLSRYLGNRVFTLHTSYCVHLTIKCLAHIRALGIRSGVLRLFFKRKDEIFSKISDGDFNQPPFFPSSNFQQILQRRMVVTFTDLR